MARGIEGVDASGTSTIVVVTVVGQFKYDMVVGTQEMVHNIGVW
jgi:hypothetical protein